MLASTACQRGTRAPSAFISPLSARIKSKTRRLLVAALKSHAVRSGQDAQKFESSCVASQTARAMGESGTSRRSASVILRRCAVRRPVLGLRFFRPSLQDGGGQAETRLGWRARTWGLLLGPRDGPGCSGSHLAYCTPS